MKHGTLQTHAQALKFLNANGGVRQVISDAQSKGLQLERLSLGRGCWRLRYVNPNRGRRQCLTIGDAPAMTLVQARELASQHRVCGIHGKVTVITPKRDRCFTKA